MFEEIVFKMYFSRVPLFYELAKEKALTPLNCPIYPRISKSFQLETMKENILFFFFSLAFALTLDLGLV